MLPQTGHFEGRVFNWSDIANPSQLVGGRDAVRSAAGRLIVRTSPPVRHRTWGSEQQAPFWL